MFIWRVLSISTTSFFCNKQKHADGIPVHILDKATETCSTPSPKIIRLAIKSTETWCKVFASQEGTVGTIKTEIIFDK